MPPVPFGLASSRWRSARKRGRASIELAGTDLGDDVRLRHLVAVFLGELQERLALVGEDGRVVRVA